LFGNLIFLDVGLKNLQEVECGDMGWIKLAQDRGRWRALMTAVMKLRVP